MQNDETARRIDAIEPVTALTREELTPEACADALRRQRARMDALLAEAPTAGWDEADERDYADRPR